MDEKSYMNSFEEYLANHPDLDPEVAERLRPVYEGLDDEVYAFIMANVVL